MAKSVYSKKGNFKGVLFVIGIVLIISGIWYTQNLVTILQDKSTEYLRFKLKVFEQSINNPNSDADFSFLFNEVIQTADYPIVSTGPNHKPQSWRNISARIDSLTLAKMSKSDSLRLFNVFKTISEENEPIPIKHQGMVIAYYYYGYSPVIYKLRVLPYFAIGVAGLFILLGYIGFSYIKKSEQRFIWVGMAKETAHQFGTPLSSISGWLELLQLDSSKKESAVSEMQNDLERLKKIANRFSKIGSYPELKPVNLNDVIEEVLIYFKKRLPNMQKRIVLESNYKTDEIVKLNTDLFEWVLENLIKNAIDAIESYSGLIGIETSAGSRDKSLYIDIIDNGKGITQSQKKNIFKPGFSSKKRGWGLGLSLARRIIQEYHGGKLYLKESKPFTKTVFRIVLNK